MAHSTKGQRAGIFAGDTRGFALVATIMAMVLISALIVAALTGARTIIRTASVDYRSTRSFFAAEGGAEAAMAQLADALEDAHLSDAELAGLSPPSLVGFTYEPYQISKIGGIHVERITDGAHAGLFALVQDLQISTRVSDALGFTAGITVDAKALSIPIFQFGVFYEHDLEITNGPPMDFAGWVHSNGNIYLSSDNAWYREMVTTPNKLYWDRKDLHIVKSGVFINNASGDAIQLDFDSRMISDPEAFRARSHAQFDDRLMTDVYGVDSLKVPLPAGVDPSAVIGPRQPGDGEQSRLAKFAWKADWHIEIDVGAVNATGSNVCQVMVVTRDGSPVPTDPECAAIFRFVWEPFFERRESRHADVFEIDVAQLFNWTGGNPAKETKSLYVTLKGTGNDPSGDGMFPVVRLVNGHTLGNEFTFATDRPLYLQGNYNTSVWQSASVASDAITILSNAWSDGTNQATSPPQPGAANTTVNAGILAGHSATPCDHEDAGCPGGNYGGGVENFPRFLENWSGVTLTYVGSLVSLFASQYATGPWGGGYYVPPNRNWSFDTRFEDPAFLPPSTPVVGRIMRTAFRPDFQ